ncbi:MAG: hypothetical protein KKD73_10100 [Proteobacteria bacterium]|nr:hypothetical protein [Pseudomonadota bacterium]MBU1641486.1 hypothetical protein [Pseudomonadota bacterium]
MEISDPNYHLKLQEMCDCYLDTDFKKKLHVMAGQSAGDVDENSIKYLALAIMYSITEKASKLSLQKKEDKVSAKMKTDTEEITLPPPSAPQFDKMVEIIRAILHIEGDKGEMALALGLRSGDLELQVKTKRKEDKESIKIEFPAL